MNLSKKLGDMKLSKVTFQATTKDRDATRAKESPGSLASRGIPVVKSQQDDKTQKTANTKQSQPPISLKGLLTAQRITRELKNRAALRRKTRARTQHRRSVVIINEQAPDTSANPSQKFPHTQAKELIDEFLDTKLRDVIYDPDSCAHLTKDLCEDIKRMVRRLTPPRYKLICNMAIGSKSQEDVIVTSQCLWDSHSDNVTSCSYENRTLFCVVLVYTVYFE
ncbi:dynein light chain Tctex-type protein 2B-like [Pelobates fuscus]|uniref:dynein light chain Tctex-type protein 2B-like n=1 Tax=Pelobates fuscus TaxID=191477 RepID=UPI002FE46F69